MKKLKLNDYQSIYYFIWDNTEETIKMVNEYLKITKGKNWTCGRCWDEKTKSNTSDTLFISKKEGTSTNNSFYRINEYVVDFVDCFWGLEKEEFDKGDFIEKCIKNKTRCK
jgi:hypothetical protein